MVKNKQPKKRAWRKADVEDVEEALEDDRLVAKLRRQAEKGESKPVDAEGSLFTIDTAGSSEGLSNKTRRELARAKIFPTKGPNIGLSATEEAKIQRAGEAVSRRPKPAGKQEVYDLWDEPTPTQEELAAKEEASASTVRRTAKFEPKGAPKTLFQKLSVAPAVVPAHEGQSMNPDSSAYEDLACMAAAKELEREQQAEFLENALRPMTAELRATKGEDALKGLDEAAKIQLYRSMVCPDAADGAESSAAPSSKRSLKMKSDAKRNREKKRTILDAKQAQLQAQRKLDKSVGEVGSILKEMKETSEWQKDRREYKVSLRKKRLDLEAKGLVGPTRIGRTKFAEEDMVVPEPPANGGLRSMPLKASAIRDRISSIMRRGMLPAPPVATSSEVIRRKNKSNKLKNSRKFMSPLLRDNLLLR